jgi:alkylation response protein AidB-like acyl-CoA dehydrogenase
MMHWYLNEQREQIMKVAREFAQTECRPAAAEIDRTHEPPVKLFKRAAELGFVGMAWPEEYGGLGLDSISYCIVMEELAKELPVLDVLISGTTTLAGKMLLMIGTEKQKKKYLPAAAKGDLIIAGGNCEPVGAQNFTEFQTRAVLDGDHWVINGAKIFTTNLASCGMVIVSVVTAPQVNPMTMEGISWIIVEKGTPGLEIGKIENKLGWHGSSTGGFFLKNVRVPKENLVGEKDKGLHAQAVFLAEENMVIGAMCLGQAESLYQKTWDYVHNRIQCGQSIFHRFQVIRHKLIKMRLEINSLRSLVYATASEAASGNSILGFGEMCKMKGVEVLQHVSIEALQLHGGNGVVVDNRLDAAYRDVRVDAIAGAAIEQLYDMVLMFIEIGMVPAMF